MPGSKISVVIPVFRSESSLEILVSRLANVSAELDRDFEIILVDDCSPDNSWAVLKGLKAKHGRMIKIVRLMTNSGQHNALLCGMSLSTGEIIITMDDDLQNPPEEIPKLISAIDNGYDLAIGSYAAKKHKALRNKSGNIIDTVQRHIFKLPRHFQLTSYRAAKRIVVENACQMSGAFPYVTSMLFTHASTYVNVPVRHEPRQFGLSNYNVKRSLSLAANLIFSYSSLPIYLTAVLCLLAFLFSLVYGMIILLKALVYGVSVPGWASTVVIITFFNSLILLSLVIFGIYLSRLYRQLTSTRTRYAIRELYE